MGFLDKFKPEQRSAMGRLIEGAEYGAVAYGMGYAQNRWGDKVHIAGAPMDLVVGILGKAAAVMGGSGSGILARTSPYTNMLGNVGIASFCHTLGAGAGGEKSGVVRAVLSNPSDVAKVKAVAPHTIVGAIPKAATGDFLSSSQLAAMAR